MSFRQILRILGVLMLIYSVTLLPPFALSLYLEDGNATAFSVAFVDISVLGMLIWFPNRRCKQDLTPRDGFIVVLMFWLVFGSIGSLPFLLAPHHELSHSAHARHRRHATLQSRNARRGEGQAHATYHPNG